MDWDTGLSDAAKHVLSLVHSISPRDVPHICYSSGRVASTMAKRFSEEAEARKDNAIRKVSFILFTVTFHANPADNWT